MFGNQDDQSSQQNTNDIPDESIHGVLNDESNQPADQSADPAGYLVSNPDPGTAPAGDQTGDQNWQHPGLPLADSSGSAPISDIIAPADAGTPATSPPVPPVPVAPSLPSTPPADDTPADDLVAIKQKALGELSPLIDQLDQTPEDKFRTMMMLIQASDDQSLIQEAYAAAHAIPDEKIRAQALLDIVNEINYFTQHQS